MPSSYQVVLWKQESFVVLRPLQIEFFRNLLGKVLTTRHNVACKLRGTAGFYVSIHPSTGTDCGYSVDRLRRGTTPSLHGVDLSWDPSPSSVIGYNIYRGTRSGGPYPLKLNSSPQPG